jgi:hypothetical protein
VRHVQNAGTDNITGAERGLLAHSFFSHSMVDATIVAVVPIAAVSAPASRGR